MSKPHSPKGLRISDEVHKALRIRAAETGESMGEIAERALRRELGMVKIDWRDLMLFDRDNDDVTDEEQILEALREFKKYGSIDGVFFHRIGAPHEDEADASTWGPQSPDDVDWTGFPHEIDVEAVTTTYGDGKEKEYEAVQLPWSVVEEILGREHDGSGDDDKVLVDALLAAGAPEWVRDADGWIDEGGWGLIGPEIEEED